MSKFSVSQKRNPFGTLLQDPALLLSVIVIWAFLVLFIIYPLSKIFILSFETDGHFTLNNILNVLGTRNQLKAFWNSLLLGTLVGICGTLLGFFFAFTAVRSNLAKSWTRFLDAAIILPLISPPFTTAIAMIFSFGPRGLITYDLLGIKTFNVYGLHSTLFAETITFFPIAYMTLKAILAGIDPNVEDMAYSLGSSRWRVFKTVTLPLTVPGLANAFLLLFAASLADFATPLILAGNSFPVLPTEAYLQITGLFDLKGGAVLSFVLLVPAIVVFFLQRYWVSRKYYVTITGKSGAQTQIKSIAPKVNYLLLGICLLICVLILYFYVLLFYASIVRAFGANHTITWRHYHVVFTEGVTAMKDTLIIAFFGMLAGGFYGVIVGYLVAKKRFVSRQMMEIVSMLNYSLPGTIVGIAYLIAFNDRPIAITGTALIIIACYVFRYGATGIRTTVAILQQIDPSIEEASLGLGADSTTTFRRITIPLILPALFTGLGVVFIRSMTAISATIFLVSINWTLITVRILEKMTELELGVAAAFSIIVVLIVFLVTIAISLFLRVFRQPGAPQMSNLLGG
ncbi:MAG: iron ABC transporter permease [Candidatus Vecturithrix sp.]|jgi:iron(III) transport system permease protein|nr:iron ABC transporter permease [Candidatus Vecturithrix sp.]